MRRRIAVAVGLALIVALAAAWNIPAKDKETRWAYVENMTDQEIRLTYDESVSGQKMRRQVSLWSGLVRKIDTSVILSDVCAWRLPELKPAEKIDCRSLKPGDHWVIH